MSPGSGIAQWCGTSSADIPQPAEAFKSAQGPVAIRLYVFVLRESSGNGGITQTQLADALAELQADYDNNNADITFDVQCVEEIKNSVYYYDPALTLNSSYGYADGINLFLSTQQSGFFVGLAQIGGNKCFARVDLANIPHTVSHEVGHCLSLYHTLRGSPCFEPGQGGNPFGDPATTGDLCADTNPDSGYYPAGSQGCETWPPNNIPSGTLQNCGSLAGNPNGYLSSPGANVLRNIMSYNRSSCVHLFTPDQISNMHAHIAAFKSNMLVNEMIITGDYTMHTNDRYFRHDIIVRNGGKLTIQAINVYMAPGKRIIVEPGGKLITTGSANVKARLSNWPAGACSVTGSNFRWGGIILEGDDPVLRSDAALNDVIIENAEVGVTYSINTTVQPKLSGGNAHFLNNQLALHLRNTTNNYSGLNFVTHTFTRCTFELTSTYPGTDFIGFVFAQNIRDMYFRGCTFNNQNYTAYPTTAISYGIRAFNTKVRIEQFNGQMPMFTNLSNPVFHSTATALPANLTLRNAQISNYRIGLTCQAASYPTITSNTFNDNVTFFNDTHYGMDINTGSIYEIAGNNFNGNPSYISRGIRVNALGGQNTFIRSNYLFNMRGGVEVLGNNQDPNNPENVGLRIYCNNFNLGQPGTLSFTDVLLGAGSAIALAQGRPNGSAGNLFTQNNTFGSDYRNQGVGLPRYFYKLFNSLHDPIPFSNINKIGVDQNPDCFSLTPPTTPGDAETDYQTYDLQYQNLHQSLTGKLDNGQTGVLLGAVQSANSNNTSAVKTQLLQASPYLSETVLSAVLNSSTLSASAISEVLVANPDVLALNTFYEQLLAKSDVFNSTQWEGIEQARQNGYTTRTGEIADVSAARARRDLYISYAVQAVLDAESMDYNAYRLWLSRLGTLEAGLQIAESWLAQQNTGAWQQQLNTIRAAESNTEKIAEIDRYESYRELLLEAADEGRTEGQLTEKEQTDVYEIATAADTYVSQMAKNLLEWYYDYSFEPSAARNAEQAETNTGKDKTPTNAIAALQVLKVYPNPAAQYLMLEKTPAQVEVPMEVQLFNFSGSLIQTIQLNTPQLRIALTAERYPAGAYHYRVLSAGKTLQSGSISVQ